eukprot:CAMPEP_0177698686 /NCGR_PEP_ID=MMETSP0484_2-20121128/5177_1 /TAXON_ID=354590 /ORGANISM="Rhodomonas lens, Strain RHODO" /LENGTH=266 /DNA_ID=CAMNT_0019209803 /DNA_START=445 /DNA_END=1246 /DNA_ORIENTATION=-
MSRGCCLDLLDGLCPAIRAAAPLRLDPKCLHDALLEVGVVGHALAAVRIRHVLVREHRAPFSEVAVGVGRRYDSVAFPAEMRQAGRASHVIAASRLLDRHPAPRTRRRHHGDLPLAEEIQPHLLDGAFPVGLPLPLQVPHPRFHPRRFLAGRDAVVAGVPGIEAAAAEVEVTARAHVQVVLLARRQARHRLDRSVEGLLGGVCEVAAVAILAEAGRCQVATRWPAPHLVDGGVAARAEGDPWRRLQLLFAMQALPALKRVGREEGI